MVAAQKSLNPIKPLLFLGAGATAAFTDQRILTSDLLENAFKDRLLDNYTSELRDFFSEIRLPQNFIPSIDEVLSVIDKAMEQNLPLCRTWGADKIRKLRQEIAALVIETIRNATNSDNPKNEMAAQIVNSMLKYAPDAWIVTLNWDCIMEQTLAGMGRSTANGSVSYGLPVSNRVGNPIAENENALILLKPHGSVNWGFCPLCMRIMCYDPDEKLALHLSCHICKADHCIEPILVAPTSIEQNIAPSVANLWYIFEDIISQCSHMTFIGYSLPPQDINMRFHLLRGLVRRDDLPIVEVIEKEHISNSDVKKRYGMFFGDSFIFSAFPDGLKGRLRSNPLF